MSRYNVKTIDRKTIEVEGKLVKNTRPSKAPSWFVEWSTSFKRDIDNRFDGIENRLDRVETRLDRVENRLDNLETRLDKVETRLDNGGL